MYDLQCLVCLRGMVVRWVLFDLCVCSLSGVSSGQRGAMNGSGRKIVSRPQGLRPSWSFPFVWA
jgi:hypothetical protein